MPVTMIKHKQIVWMFFFYKKCMKITTTYLVQNSKGKYKVGLLRVWGMVSELRAFSQALGGGVYCNENTYSKK